MPSLFSITLAFLPSITATQELVVPRSIPMTLLMDTSLQKQDRAAPGKHRPDPPQVIVQPLPDCWAYICDRPSRYNQPKPVALRALDRRGRASRARRLGRVASLLGDPDHRRAQQSVVDAIAGLQYLDDRAGR